MNRQLTISLCANTMQEDDEITGLCHLRLFEQCPQEDLPCPLDGKVGPYLNQPWLSLFQRFIVCRNVALLDGVF